MNIVVVIIIFLIILLIIFSVIYLMVTDKKKETKTGEYVDRKDTEMHRDTGQLEDVKREQKHEMIRKK